MLRRQHYIAIGLVALLTLIVLNLPSHATSRLKLAFGSFFLPLFGLAKASQHVTRQAGEALTPRSELQRQIDQLRRTNDHLQMRALQADALAAENDQLRQLIGWQRQSPWKCRLANVVARDPANWWQVAWIDLGARDGIRADLPVMTTNGLVGRISLVNPFRSQILLITSPDCHVSAIIDKGHGSHEMGVVVGSASPFDNSLVTLSYLSSTSNLKPGQPVITSGIGGIFPKGIAIGQIAEDSRTVDFGLRAEARVKLSADLGALEQVWVLLP